MKKGREMMTSISVGLNNIYHSIWTLQKLRLNLGLLCWRYNNYIIKPGKRCGILASSLCGNINIRNTHDFFLWIFFGYTIDEYRKCVLVVGHI